MKPSIIFVLAVGFASIHVLSYADGISGIYQAKIGTSRSCLQIKQDGESLSGQIESFSYDPTAALGYYRPIMQYTGSLQGKVIRLSIHGIDAVGVWRSGSIYLQFLTKHNPPTVKFEPSSEKSWANTVRVFRRTASIKRRIVILRRDYDQQNAAISGGKEILRMDQQKLAVAAKAGETTGSNVAELKGWMAAVRKTLMASSAKAKRDKVEMEKLNRQLKALGG